MVWRGMYTFCFLYFIINYLFFLSFSSMCILLLSFLLIAYFRWLIFLSYLIAWAAASASLYIVSFCYLLWQQLVAALIMSLAVCGMHFVGNPHFPSASWLSSMPPLLPCIPSHFFSPLLQVWHQRHTTKGQAHKRQ